MLDQANEDTNADADVYVMQPSGLYDLNIEISELFSTEPVQYDLSLISLSFSSLGGVARNFPGVGGGGGGGGRGGAHTFSNPGYLPLCHVDIPTVFSESDIFLGEQRMRGKGQAYKIAAYMK